MGRSLTQPAIADGTRAASGCAAVSQSSRMLRRSAWPRTSADDEHRRPQPPAYAHRIARHSRRRATATGGCIQAARRTSGGRACTLGALAGAWPLRGPVGRARGDRSGGDHDVAPDPPHAEQDRPGSRRSRAHSLGDRLGGSRDAASAASPVQRERLLSAPAQPGLLGLPAGLRPGRPVRVGHRRRARPLQPALPVRVVAVLRRRLPAGPRARPGPARGGRRRRRVRVRPLPGDRGGAPARDLLGGHPPRALPAAPRLPPGLPRARARGLAGDGVAGEPRLHAGPAVLLPARDPGGDRGDPLVAWRPAGGRRFAAGASPRRRDGLGRGRARAGG
jgi:hypothetical protein